jgi:hypothetical protein
MTRSGLQQSAGVPLRFGTRSDAQAYLELGLRAPFAKGLHRAPGKILGGWQVGAILSLFSGVPIGITSASNNTFSQGGNQHPNWNGVSPEVSGPTADRWIDSAKFSNSPAFTFGNVGRTLNGLRSDRTKELDLSLHKNTNVTEKLKLQFRAEIFNITNTPQFGAAELGVWKRAVRHGLGAEQPAAHRTVCADADHVTARR